MIETVEQLKQERPDLVKLFESMNKDQLLEQTYKECMDAINMEERVQTFMNECTGLSKTNYPIPIIKKLIQDYRENHNELLIEMILEDIDEMTAEEIKDYLRTF